MRNMCWKNLPWILILPKRIWSRSSSCKGDIPTILPRSRLKHDRFHDFYHSTTSCILLVKGNMKLNSKGAISSLTYMSWIIFYKMPALDPNYIRFFHICGPHTHDRYSQLSGTLSCLNTQLLSDSQGVNSLRFSKNWINDLYTEELCELLRILISASTHHTIFILIDGATSMERVTHIDNICCDATESGQ
jgi:hypothetical protein